MAQRMRRGRASDAGALHGALEGALEGLVVQVMAPLDAGARARPRCSACGKTQNQAHDAPARGYLRSSASGICTPPRPARASACHSAVRALQLRLQRRRQRGRQHDDAVLAALAVAHDDDAALEVDILDAQLQRLGDAHAGAVEQLRQHAVRAVEQRQHARAPRPPTAPPAAAACAAGDRSPASTADCWPNTCWYRNSSADSACRCVDTDTWRSAASQDRKACTSRRPSRAGGASRGSARTRAPNGRRPPPCVCCSAGSAPARAPGPAGGATGARAAGGENMAAGNCMSIQSTTRTPRRQARDSPSFGGPLRPYPDTGAESRHYPGRGADCAREHVRFRRKQCRESSVGNTYASLILGR